MQDLSRSAGVQEFGMKYYWLKLCLLCYGMPGISAQNISRHPPKSHLNSRNSKIRLENSSNISGKNLGETLEERLALYVKSLARVFWRSDLRAKTDMVHFRDIRCTLSVPHRVLQKCSGNNHQPQNVFEMPCDTP